MQSDYYKDPMKRGFLSSPTVDLEKLGLAPPSKTKSPLPAVRLTDLVTRSHSILMASDLKTKLRLELILAKKEYERELQLAMQYNYLDGKNRIPKKIPLKV
jgi:hypothetical protein